MKISADAESQARIDVADAHKRGAVGI